METFNLAFSDEEMTRFLERRGYTIEKVKTYESYRISHYDDLEYEDREVLIAYKDERPSEDDLSGDMYSIRMRWGLKRNFQKEFYDALLNL